MGRANVKIQVNFEEIEKKLAPETVKRGRLAMYSQAMMDMDKYVPRKAGDLRSSARQVDDGIEYNTKYARAQYYGGAYNKHTSFTFSWYTTPGTGPRWDKKVPSDKKKKWGQMALKAMGFKT